LINRRRFACASSVTRGLKRMMFVMAFTALMLCLRA
jgi:hypothetical protein